MAPTELGSALESNSILSSTVGASVAAIGDNQGAEMEFGDKQALSTFEKTYVIHGIIFQMNATANSIIATLNSWEVGAKSSLGIFDQGRFGIIISDDTTKSFEPIASTLTGPQGLMWLDIAYTLDFENNQQKFTLRLTVSKGNGT